MFLVVSKQHQGSEPPLPCSTQPAAPGAAPSLPTPALQWAKWPRKRWKRGCRTSGWKSWNCECMEKPSIFLFSATCVHGKIKSVPSPDSFLAFGCSSRRCSPGSLLIVKRLAELGSASAVRSVGTEPMVSLVKQHTLGDALGQIRLWCQTELLHQGPTFHNLSFNFPAPAAMQYLLQLFAIKTWPKIWPLWMIQIIISNNKKGKCTVVFFSKAFNRTHLVLSFVKIYTHFLLVFFLSFF